MNRNEDVQETARWERSKLNTEYEFEGDLPDDTSQVRLAALIEFIEKTMGLPLTEWQKNVLMGAVTEPVEQVSACVVSIQPRLAGAARWSQIMQPGQINTIPISLLAMTRDGNVIKLDVAFDVTARAV